MSFGKNIAKMRAQKGYSKEYVAVSLGITVASLNSWESDSRSPTLKKASELAAFYGVIVDELLDVPSDKHRNLAETKTNPAKQSSIERINRMREAGLSEEQIDSAINYAIEITTKKRPS